MVIVPKHRPLVEALNSYYVDLKRLIEHFQGHIGAGAVRLKSKAVHGVLYFDKDEVLNAMLQEENESLKKGPEAVAHIEEMASRHSLEIDVYKIPADEIYLWTNVCDSEPIYQGLSSEFTALENLIKKLLDEGFTGFIDIIFSDENEGGILFFVGGKVTCGAFSWQSSPQKDSKAMIRSAVRKTHETPSRFDVYRIVPGEGNRRSKVPAEKDAKEIASVLETFLHIVEDAFSEKGKKDHDFDRLLRKKFLEKTDAFPFLDPFAGEFEYRQRKIIVSDAVEKAALTEGLMACVMEMADQGGVLSALKSPLSAWFQENEEHLKKLGVSSIPRLP